MFFRADVWAICLTLSTILALVSSSDGKLVDDRQEAGETTKSSKSRGHNVDSSDPFGWSKSYMDEYEYWHFRTTGVEDSIDQRHANLILSQELYRPLNLNQNTFKNDSVTNEAYTSYINGPEVDQDACSSHLRLMIDLVKELAQINTQRRSINATQNVPDLPAIEERHIHLARILDSYGRYESGALSGTHRMYGAREQCLETPLLLGVGAKQQVVNTRACSAKLKITPHLDQRMLSLLNRAEVNIELAICLPNTCHSNSLSNNKHLIQWLVDTQFQMPETIYVDKHREVESLFCLNDWNESMIELPTSGKILIGLICVWLTTMLYVTYNSDRLRSHGSWIPLTLINCADLRLHMSNLVGINDVPDKNIGSRVDFGTLNIIKITFILAAVYGHTMIFSVFTASDIIRVYASVHKTSFLGSFYNRTLAVDTMFVITGILLTFITLRKIDSSSASKKLNRPIPFAVTCFMIGLARYLRIVPALALVFWFKKTVWMYIGNGYLWIKTFSNETFYGACKQEPWYSPFTTLPTQLPLERQCMPQTWSVICDTRFAFLAAPFILLLRKRPKLVIALAIILTAYSSVLMYRACHQIEPEYIALLTNIKGDAMAIFGRNTGTVYTTFQNRFGGLFIGLIAGYIIFLYYKSQIKDWPNWFKNHATKFAASFVISVELVPLLLPVLYRNFYAVVEPIRPHIAKHFFVTMRPFWCTANAVIMMRMITDWKDSTFFKLTNGNLLRMVSKVMYSVALVHVEVIVYFLTQTNDLITRFTMANALSLGSNSLLVSFVFGTLFHLIFESPIHVLVDKFLMSIAALTMKEPHKKDE